MYIFTGSRWRRVTRLKDGGICVKGWRQAVKLLAVRAGQLEEITSDLHFVFGPSLEKLPTTNKENSGNKNIHIKSQGKISKSFNAAQLPPKGSGSSKKTGEISVSEENNKEDIRDVDSILELSKTRDVDNIPKRQLDLSHDVEAAVERLHIESRSSSFDTLKTPLIERQRDSSSLEQKITPLEISVSDVTLVQNFITKNHSNEQYLRLINLDHIDVERFPLDDCYTQNVLYKLHPRVKIERLTKRTIGQLLKGKSKPISQKEFAKKLGLRLVGSVVDAPPTKMTRTRSKPTIVLASSSDSDSSPTRTQSKHSCRSTKRSTRESTDKESTTTQIRVDIPKKLFNSPTTRVTSAKNLSLKKRVTSPTNLSPPPPPKKRCTLPKNLVSPYRIASPKSKRPGNSPERRKISPTSCATMVTSSPKKMCDRRLEEMIRKDPQPKQNSSLPEPKKLRAIEVPRSRLSLADRGYSSLEDHTIIAWLLKDNQRQRLVSGNRIWKELQMDFKTLSGTERTWHSLRNRYLRHILPNLGRMALDEQSAISLRKNFALGDETQRKKIKISAQNSMLVLPTVRSAFTAGKLRTQTTNRTQESPKESSKGENSSLQKKSTSKSRNHPANAREQARERDREHVEDNSPLSYSQITKRFDRQKRSTPQNSSVSLASGPRFPVKRSRRLYNATELK